MRYHLFVNCKKEKDLPRVRVSGVREPNIVENKGVAATILAARKLIDMDPNKPNMAKGFFVDRAIEDAAFILERIDKKWPAIENKISRD